MNYIHQWGLLHCSDHPCCIIYYVSVLISFIWWDIELLAFNSCLWLLLFSLIIIWSLRNLISSSLHYSVLHLTEKQSFFYINLHLQAPVSTLSSRSSDESFSLTEYLSAHRLSCWLFTLLKRVLLTIVRVLSFLSLKLDILDVVSYYKDLVSHFKTNDFMLHIISDFYCYVSKS